MDTTLIDDYREKLEDYLKSEEVNLDILTNAQEYEFFRRQVSGGQGEVRLVSQIGLDELENRIGILEAYSKDAIENDEWQKILNRLSELRSAKYTLTVSANQIPLNMSRFDG